MLLADILVSSLGQQTISTPGMTSLRDGVKTAEQVAEETVGIFDSTHRGVWMNWSFQNKINSHASLGNSKQSWSHS